MTKVQRLSHRSEKEPKCVTDHLIDSHSFVWIKSNQKPAGEHVFDFTLVNEKKNKKNICAHAITVSDSLSAFF